MSSDAPTLLVEVEETGPCSRRLTITVPASRVDSEIEESLNNVAQAVQFRGFRRGKAPMRLVKARLGARVLEDVAERLRDAAIDEAIQQESLEPVGFVEKASVEVVEGEDLEFAIALDVRPQFEVPELKGIEVARPSTAVTDEDVDAEVERIRYSRASIENQGDEPLEEEGVATLEVTMTAGEDKIVDAQEIDWNHPSNLLGGMKIEGLADGLLGKKRGDEATFETTLPDDFFMDEHKGKTADVALKVTAVKKIELPVLDAAFADDLDYDDLEEMRGDLAKQLERRREAETDHALDEAVTSALLEAVEFDVPPSMVNNEAGRMLRRYEMNLRAQGVDEEDVVARVLEAKEEAETTVKRSLRASFILESIAADRRVVVTENEVQQELASMAARYNRTPAEMETYVERNGLMSAMRASLRERKTLRELRDVLKIVEAEPGDTGDAEA